MIVLEALSRSSWAWVRISSCTVILPQDEFLLRHVSCSQWVVIGGSLHLLFCSSCCCEDVSSSWSSFDCAQWPLGHSGRAPFNRASDCLLITVNTSSLRLSELAPWCGIQSSKLLLEQLLLWSLLLSYLPHPLSGASCCGLWYRLSLSSWRSNTSDLSVMIGGMPVSPFPRCLGSAEGITNYFSFGDFSPYMLGGTEPSSLSSSLSGRDMSMICEIVTSLLSPTQI